MSIFRMLSRIKAEPWAITQDYMDTIVQMAEAHGETPQAVAAKMGERLAGTYNVQVRDGVAVLPIKGVLSRYDSFFNWLFGGSAYEDMAIEFARAVNDPNITAVMLDIDSPGGEANGVSEFADQIRAATHVKPVVAYVGGSASSAAYWLASAAQEVIINDIAELGSIGAVIGYRDYSERDAKSGVRKFEIVSAQSPYKRVDPSTEEGRSKIQARVDALAAVFVDKVAAYRGTSTETVLKDFGKGDVLIGQAAVSAGLADRIGSYEGVISELSGADGGSGFSTAAAGGTQLEDRGMPFYLSQQAPAAGDEQRNMEATAANLARLCPEAAEQLRQEGAAAKQAELGSATASAEQAVTSERERVKSILGSAEAEGRTELANHLAFETDMKPEAAVAMLSKSAKAAPVKSDPLAAAMQDVPNPAVGADQTATADDDLDAAIARSIELGKQLNC